MAIAPASFKLGGEDRRPADPSEHSRTLPDAVAWGELERKLADRLAGQPTKTGRPWTKSKSEPPAESGVRISAMDDAPRALTYSVYTINDLDSGSVGRASLASIPTQPIPGAFRWLQVSRSARALAQVFWAGWLNAAKPRQRITDVCGAPALQLATDLKIALQASSWKKIGFVTGSAFATIFVLLFAVLALADLTDDLKPTSNVTSSVSERASLPLEARAQAVPAQPAPAQAAPAPPAIEIVDAPAPAAPAKPIKGPKKPPKSEVEIFIP